MPKFYLKLPGQTTECLGWDLGQRIRLSPCSPDCYLLSLPAGGIFSPLVLGKATSFFRILELALGLLFAQSPLGTCPLYPHY